MYLTLNFLRLYTSITCKMPWYRDSFVNEFMFVDIRNFKLSDIVCRNGIRLMSITSTNNRTFLCFSINCLGTMIRFGLTFLVLLLTDELRIFITSFPCMASALRASWDVMGVFNISPWLSHLENFLKGGLPNLFDRSFASWANCLSFLVNEFCLLETVWRSV